MDKISSEQKRQRLQLIDGSGPEPVIMVTGPVADLPPCPPGKHCAAHTGGPTFPCCRCGATFKAAS
jgi:hypothetical protein